MTERDLELLTARNIATIYQLLERFLSTIERLHHENTKLFASLEKQQRALARLREQLRARPR